MKRNEILRSPEYWFDLAQNELFRQLTEYMEQHNLNRSQLAEKLGVTKGYISQVLNGNFNYTLKKLIELSLSIDKVPQITYQPVTGIIDKVKNQHSFSFSMTSDQLALNAVSNAVGTMTNSYQTFSNAESIKKIAA